MSDSKTRRATSDSDTADCHCGLWTTRPAYLREQGIPEGFCGICQHCNRPGHTRHFPGPVPYTGSWCDACYGKLAGSWPFRSLAVWIMLLLLGLTAYSLLHFIRKLVE